MRGKCTAFVCKDIIWSGHFFVPCPQNNNTSPHRIFGYSINLLLWKNIANPSSPEITQKITVPRIL